MLFVRNLRIAGSTFIWRDGEVATLLRSANGEVGKDVQRRAYAVQKRMKRLAPVWSGALRNGIRVESTRESPIGPFSRVVSDAPHTLVAVFGRGEVIASGLRGGGRQRTKISLAKSTLTWGSESAGRPLALTIRLSPGGGFYFASKAGPAAGSNFMDASIDAALD